MSRLVIIAIILVENKIPVNLPSFGRWGPKVEGCGDARTK